MSANFATLQEEALANPQLTPKPPGMVIRDISGSRQELVGISVNA